MTDFNEPLDIPYAVAALPSGPERPAFCARSSGLYRSVDGGRSWENVYLASTLGESPATLAIALSPDFLEDNTLFAGVPGAVLRSTDGGAGWKALPLPAPPPLVSSLVISPGFTADGVILAGTVEDGVFRSANRGEHWTAWNFGLLDLNILCLVISPGFSDDETLYVGAESGIFRSTNGGRAWREVNFPPELAPVISLALSSGYPEDKTLLAGTEENGLFLSQDDGETWARLDGEGEAAPVNALFLSPRYPEKPDILALMGASVVVSRDGGITWQAWKFKEPLKGEILCLAAPRGIQPGAPLLAGLEDGAGWF